MKQYQTPEEMAEEFQAVYNRLAPIHNCFTHYALSWRCLVTEVCRELFFTQTMPAVNCSLGDLHYIYHLQSERLQFSDNALEAFALTRCGLRLKWAGQRQDQHRAQLSPDDARKLITALICAISAKERKGAF